MQKDLIVTTLVGGAWRTNQFESDSPTVEGDVIRWITGSPKEVEFVAMMKKHRDHQCLYANHSIDDWLALSGMRSIGPFWVWPNKEEVVMGILRKAGVPAFGGRLICDHWLKITIDVGDLVYPVSGEAVEAPTGDSYILNFGEQGDNFGIYREDRRTKTNLLTAAIRLTRFHWCDGSIGYCFADQKSFIEYVGKRTNVSDVLKKKLSDTLSKDGYYSFVQPRDVLSIIATASVY